MSRLSSGNVAPSSPLEEYLAEKCFGLGDIALQLDLSDDEIPFVTGSVLDGIGDSSSDLDVFVLAGPGGLERRSALRSAERRQQQERLRFAIVYLQIGPNEIDAEFHEVRKLRDMFAALDGMDPRNYDEIFASAESLGRFERSEAVDLLHRFRIGAPIANSRAFHELRAEFDEAKYLLWNAHYHLMKAREYQRGVKRSLANDDPENAYLKLTRLYDSLGDAYLFACGQSLDRWKWRLPKLRIHAGPAFLERYLAVQLLRAGGRSLPAFVTQALDQSGQFAESIASTAGL